ncbi:MAG: hypothetical protein ACKVOE_00790 [Rickettsiales bacterium]
MKTAAELKRMGFREGEIHVVQQMATSEAEGAALLRYKLVESSVDTGQQIVLKLAIPENLKLEPYVADEGHNVNEPKHWAYRKLDAIFPPSQRDYQTGDVDPESRTISVTLTGNAAERYRTMMHDLDQTEARIARQSALQV